MKYLRRKCVRCTEDIKSDFINEEKQVYACPNCNSLSSLFEERDFREEPKVIAIHESIRTEYLGSDFYIYLEKMSTGEMSRSLIGTALILLFFWGLFVLTGSPFFAWLTLWLGGMAWLINLLFYARIEIRTYEIALSPFEVIFYEKLFGQKRVLKRIPSYEIDRIQIVTKANETVPGKQRTDFIIQTKQYLQIKPFHHSSDTVPQLEYLKFLMDRYLNIQERISDIKE